MPAMLILRAARSNEAIALTDLCIRSKAIWGYDSDFMGACRNELTLTPLALQQPGVQVADIDGNAVGIVELKFTGRVAILERLFVDPLCLRTGTGRKLFDWARTMAIANGASMLVIESDPQAADFYRCMGATDDGSVPSASVAGRIIPRLKLLL